MPKTSLLYRVNLFIRSLLFSISLITIIIPYSIFCLMLWPFPLTVRFRAIDIWARVNVWLLKVLCRIDFHIEGLENISKVRNGVVLCKHQSAWETFMMPRLFRDPAIILKKELLWLPFFGWGAATVHPIAINRNDRSSAMEQIIKKGTQCLQDGRWVIIFPEGTRTAPGHVGKYRLGGARLAVHADYPVLPIAHNAGCFWPRRQFIKIPGTVKMVIGPMIESTNRTPEEVNELAQTWIETTMRRIDPHSYRTV